LWTCFREAASYVFRLVGRHKKDTCYLETVIPHQPFLIPLKTEDGSVFLFR
jgi:hypothetical protein